MDSLKALRKMGVRQLLVQSLSFVSVLASGFMMWKALGLVCNTASPIVVVLSGSMEPAFYRGDLLFLTNFKSEKFEIGDITVYQLRHQAVPIVHRVIEVHEQWNEPALSAGVPAEQLLLTKGDNNLDNDLTLYGGVKWLKRTDVIGRVRGFLPYIGYVTIALNDFPQLKYALLGGLALLALFQREQ